MVKTKRTLSSLHSPKQLVVRARALHEGNVTRNAPDEQPVARMAYVALVAA